MHSKTTKEKTEKKMGRPVLGNGINVGGAVFFFPFFLLSFFFLLKYPNTKPHEPEWSEAERRREATAHTPEA